MNSNKNDYYDFLLDAEIKEGWSFEEYSNICAGSDLTWKEVLTLAATRNYFSACYGSNYGVADCSGIAEMTDGKLTSRAVRGCIGTLTKKGKLVSKEYKEGTYIEIQ